MENSKIQWTDSTINFWHGCKKVSAGCMYCYMYRDKDRLGQDPTTVLRTSPETFNKALNWKKGRRIFTCSWSDFFIKEADAWRADAWDVIRRTPQHSWQILTKRPERILECLPPDWGEGWDNVWLGVSIENQKSFYRAVTLSKIPCKTRFISAEPLIDELDLIPTEYGGSIIDQFQWCIIGGESGNEKGKYRYRECKEEWIQKIIQDLQGTGVKVFVKQLGTYLAKQQALNDKHGGDMDEWNQSLQVRQFPNTLSFAASATLPASQTDRSSDTDEVVPIILQEEERGDEKVPSYVMTGQQVLALGATEIPMLIDPILPKVGVGVLCGGSDTGKSYLGLNVALSICSNDATTLGLKINRQHGSVIIVCTEDTAQDVCFRMTPLCKGKSLNKNTPRFIFGTDSILNRLTRELNRKPADLVIMDTFGDLFTGSINDSIDVRKFFRPYKDLASTHQCLILFNHHIGKGKENHGAPSKNDVLGSQAIESSSRVVLVLNKRADSTRVLSVVKGNHIPDEIKEEGLVFNFTKEDGFIPTGEKVLAKATSTEVDDDLGKKVVELHKELGSYKKVSEKLKEEGISIQKNRIGEILKKYSPSVPVTNDLDDGQVKDEEEIDNGKVGKEELDEAA